MSEEGGERTLDARMDTQCDPDTSRTAATNEAVRPTLSACRIGVSIRCGVCGHSKKPIGRAEPLGAIYCTDECEGYRQQVCPGSLWPGESEADFGYPVSAAGTTDAAHPSHRWGVLACLACDCGSRHQAALEPCTLAAIAKAEGR